MTRERIIGFDLATGGDTTGIAIITMHKGEPFVLDILERPTNLDLVTSLIDEMKGQVADAMRLPGHLLVERRPTLAEFHERIARVGGSYTVPRFSALLDLLTGPLAPMTRRAKRRARGRAKAARRAAR